MFVNHGEISTLRGIYVFTPTWHLTSSQMEIHLHPDIQISTQVWHLSHRTPEFPYALEAACNTSIVNHFSKYIKLQKYGNVIPSSGWWFERDVTASWSDIGALENMFVVFLLTKIKWLYYYFCLPITIQEWFFIVIINIWWQVICIYYHIDNLYFLSQSRQSCYINWSVTFALIRYSK